LDKESKGKMNYENICIVWGGVSRSDSLLDHPNHFLITQLDPQAPCQDSIVVHSY
jgi:hypothetical protein